MFYLEQMISNILVKRFIFLFFFSFTLFVICQQLSHAMESSNAPLFENNDNGSSSQELNTQGSFENESLTEPTPDVSPILTEEEKKALKQKEKEEKKRLKKLEKEEKKRKEEEEKKKKEQEKLEKKQNHSSSVNNSVDKKPGSERVYIIHRILPAIWWNINPSEKVTKLEINLSEQKLYVYQGGRLAAISPICSGTKDHPTPLGRFTVINKEILHRSNRYGCFVDSKGKIIYANATVGMTPPAGLHYEPADMPFFLRLTDDGVGLHGGYLPGYAASHGCVRLPKSFAQDLYPLVPLGTPVVVRD